MLVHLAGEHIRDRVAPVQLLAQRDEMLLDALQYGAEVEFWVFQEADEQLQRAVARAAPQPVDGGVQAAGAQDQRLDGVGVRELLVVVRVNADHLAAPLDGLQEGQRQVANLLGIERAEAVHQVDGVHRALHQRRQRVFKVAVQHGGDRHQVERGLVPLLVRVGDHVDGGGNLVDVGGHADAVEDALLLWQDVGVVIRPLGIRHGAQLHLARVVAHDSPDVVFVGILPRAVLLAREDLLRCLVADLHIIHTGGHAGVVDRLHEMFLEQMIVDQPAVAYRAVQHLDFRPVCHQRALGQLVFVMRHRSHPRE